MSRLFWRFSRLLVIGKLSERERLTRMAASKTCFRRVIRSGRECTASPLRQGHITLREIVKAFTRKLASPSRSWMQLSITTFLFCSALTATQLIEGANYGLALRPLHESDH